MIFIDPPVRPAIDGTATLGTAELGATYTAGSNTDVVLKRMLGSPLSVDIETFGLGKDALRIKSVAFSDGVQTAVLDPRDPAGADAIMVGLMDAPALVFHNSTFDVPNLYRNGLIDLRSISKVTDTLIYARLAFPDMLDRKGLDALAKRFLGLDSEETIKNAFRRLGLTIQEGYRRLDINSPMYLMGNAMDALVTMRILPHVRRAALATLTAGHPFSTYGVTGDEATRLVEREQRINRMMLRRACRGLRVDLEFLDQFRERYNADRFAAERVLASRDIRPGNAGDLIKFLESTDALPADWPRTKTGRPSTTATNLDRLTNETARLFVQAKQIAKIEGDYLSKVVDLADDDDRVHPELNLLAATTGRASMGNPPLHQFPEGARGVILADDGDSLSSIDWAQIEPVVAANIAGDLKVLQGYEDGTSDLYTDLAGYAGINRKTAKVVLLAQLYGEGMAKLATDLDLKTPAGEPDIDAAKELREFIFRAMPKTGRLIWKLRAIGEQYRKVFTMSGRILTIPMGRGWQGGPPSVATHKAVNYFVQGSAYDVLAESLIAIEDAGLGDAVYLTMHDEIICSTAAAGEIERIMQTPPERLCMLAKRTPVLRTDRADLGDRWASA